jgi:hypothetical protein
VLVGKRPRPGVIPGIHCTKIEIRALEQERHGGKDKKRNSACRVQKLEKRRLKLRYPRGWQEAPAAAVSRRGLDSSTAPPA